MGCNGGAEALNQIQATMIPNAQLISSPVLHSIRMCNALSHFHVQIERRKKRRKEGKHFEFISMYKTRRNPGHKKESSWILF